MSISTDVIVQLGSFFFFFFFLFFFFFFFFFALMLYAIMLVLDVIEPCYRQ